MKKVYGDKFCVSVKNIINFDCIFENLVKESKENEKPIKIVKSTTRIKREYNLTSENQSLFLNGGIDVSFGNIHYQIGLTKFATYKESSSFDEDFNNYDRSIEWITFLLKKYKKEYLPYAKLAFRKLERDMNSAYNQEFGSYKEDHKEAYFTSNYGKYASKSYQLNLLKSLIKDIEVEEQSEF